MTDECYQTVDFVHLILESVDIHKNKSSHQNRSPCYVKTVHSHLLNLDAIRTVPLDGLNC